MSCSPPELRDERLDARQVVEGAHDRLGRAQVLDRLEQRHDDEVELGARALSPRAERAAHQAAFLLQQQHFEQVAHRLGVADDVVADGLGAEGRAQLARRLEDREFAPASPR